MFDEQSWRDERLYEARNRVLRLELELQQARRDLAVLEPSPYQKQQMLSGLQASADRYQDQLQRTYGTVQPAFGTPLRARD